MKRTIIICLLAMPTLLMAQLKVYNNGKCSIARNVQFSMNNLSIGQHGTPTDYINYNNGIHTHVPSQSVKFNIALIGESCISPAINSGRSYGTVGVAGNTTNGYNYGVMGKLYGSQNGASIYGTLYDDMGININGRYAGYFRGNTYVDGTLNATSVVNTSDIRLKTNVRSLCKYDNTIDNIMNMNVISYNYKPREFPSAELDTVQQAYLDEYLKNEKERAGLLHYGLSAQELQEIYPELVVKGQDGFLSVNYIELIPILIRSIQELKEKVDSLQGKTKRSQELSTTNSRINTAVDNILYQNFPNPYKEQTVIRFRLSNNIQSAAICIFDIQGKMIKKLPVSFGEESVTINGYELGEGLYLYSLVVNGQEIDTKKMIISK